MLSSSFPVILALGILVGVAGGMLGIGGGVLVIPILVVGFGFSQEKANGTSVAMLLPPIGLFAAASYYRAGNVDVRFAALLSAGFAGGAFVGARLVNLHKINETALRVGFAVLLLYVASRMLFRPGGRARSAGETTALMAAYMGTYFTLRLVGRRWATRPSDWADVYRAKTSRAIEHDYEI